MSYSTPSPASRTLQCATCSPAHALQDFSCLRSAAPPAELAGLGPGFFSDYSCLKPSFSHASALSSMLYQHLAIVSRAICCRRTGLLHSDARVIARFPGAGLAMSVSDQVWCTVPTHVCGLKCKCIHAGPSVPRASPPSRRLPIFTAALNCTPLTALTHSKASVF